MNLEEKADNKAEKPELITPVLGVDGTKLQITGTACELISIVIAM